LGAKTRHSAPIQNKIASPLINGNLKKYYKISELFIILLKMKFAISLAVFAIINNVSAVEAAAIKDDNLFTDDGEAAETLSSLRTAEKIH